MPLVHRAAPFPLAPSRAGDWVQNLPTDATAATAKWGDIGDWDVSDVTDFSYSFSKHRNAVGGSQVVDGNPKAEKMNSGLGKWNVAKVTTMKEMFHTAVKFVGTGLDSWITSSLTSLVWALPCNEMNADLSSWDVAKVTNMRGTFNRAYKFTGTGLAKWNVAAVTDMSKTFFVNHQLTADLSSWDVAKVTTLQETFRYASGVNIGWSLAKWNTAAVTDLGYTFATCGKMDVDLSSWDVAKVKVMTNTFAGTSSLASCNKRRIVDAWTAASDPGGSTFTATTYDTDWAGETCAGATVTFNDAQFKQASCKLRARCIQTYASPHPNIRPSLRPNCPAT